MQCCVCTILHTVDRRVRTKMCTAKLPRAEAKRFLQDVPHRTAYHRALIIKWPRDAAVLLTCTWIRLSSTEVLGMSKVRCGPFRLPFICSNFRVVWLPTFHCSEFQNLTLSNTIHISNVQHLKMASTLFTMPLVLCCTAC